MTGGGKVSGRRHIGGDVYLATYPVRPGGTASGELRLDLGFAVADWKAANPGSMLRAAFPGTAIEIESQWYEISEVETSRGAPHRVYYRLRPWSSAEVIRTAFELTPEACAALTLKHKEQARRQSRAKTLGTIPFLTGLLPREEQQELEQSYGVSSIAATWISAGLMLSLSMLGVVVAFAHSRGMTFGEHKELVKTIADQAPLSAYGVVESLVRLMAVASHQPMGSLPVVLLALAWRGLRKLVTPRRKPKVKIGRAPQTAGQPRPGHGMLAARDRVRRLDGPGDTLEILSRLGKDHWTANVTAIEFEGQPYQLVEREVIETERGQRHRFLLRKAAHDALFRSYLKYQPEEVRDVYRAQQRLRTAMWVETVPFLWGLIEPATQQRLAKTYTYDPYRWTRWTIVAGGLVGLILGLGSWGQMLAGTAGAGDGVTLFCAVVLLLETAIRWSKIKDGELRGSLLGLPFEPLALWFLRWE